MHQAITYEFYLGETVNLADITRNKQSIDYSNDFKVIKKISESAAKTFENRRNGCWSFKIFTSDASSGLSRNDLGCKNKKISGWFDIQGFSNFEI